MRTLTYAASILLTMLPVAALADSFTITNVTSHSVTYGIKCDDKKDSWHTFTLKSLGSVDTLSGDWNYSCDNEKYSIRVADITGNDFNGENFSETNTPKHAFVNDNVSGTVITETSHLITMQNTSKVTVNVDYHCIKGGPGENSVNVPAGNFSYAYFPGCTTFNVALNVATGNGATMTLTRSVAADAMYRLVPTNGTFDIVKIGKFPEP